MSPQLLTLTRAGLGHAMHALHLVAQTTAPVAGAPTTSPATSAPAAQPPFWLSKEFLQFAPIVAMLAIFYLLMFRSRGKQDRQVKDMLSQMKRGDKVMTIGGIMGTVVEAREKDVILKVDESNNTKIKFRRDAIKTVLEDDGAEK